MQNFIKVVKPRDFAGDVEEEEWVSGSVASVFSVPFVHVQKYCLPNSWM